MHCSGTALSKCSAECCQRACFLNKRKWNSLILCGTSAVWRILLSAVKCIQGLKTDKTGTMAEEGYFFILEVTHLLFVLQSVLA